MQTEEKSLCINFFQKLERFRNPEKDSNDPEPNDEDGDKLLDTDLLCRHILDCMHVLRVVKSLKVTEGVQEEKDAVIAGSSAQSLLKAKMTVFSAALQHSTDRLNDEEPTPNAAVSSMLDVFRSEPNLTPDRHWLPLHWATAMVDKVGEDVVKTIYLADPTVLRNVQYDYRYPNAPEIGGMEWLVGNPFEPRDRQFGCIPLHLICMVPKPDLNMLRYFAETNPGAFEVASSSECISRGAYPLHLAARHCESVDTLQLLIQICPSSHLEKGDEKGLYPIGALVSRDNIDFPAFQDMFECLLQANHSANVVRNVVKTLIHELFPRTSSEIYSDMAKRLTSQQREYYYLLLIERMLREYPEAAYGRIVPEGDTLLTALTRRHTPVDSVEMHAKVLQLLIDANPDAVRERSNESADLLPIHISSRTGNITGMKLLLNAYPESVTSVDDDGNNILHQLGKYDEYQQSVSRPGAVDFLRSHCASHPQLIRQRNKYGFMPIHETLFYDGSYPRFGDIELIRFLHELDPLLIREPVICPAQNENEEDGIWEDRRYYHLALPLHLAVAVIGSFVEPTLTEEIELLLRWYPEAANIRDGNGKTPYDIVKVYNNVNPRALRVLLRAAPEQSPAELHELNWAARKMAMFLSFRAITKNPQPTMFAKLRFENKDLLRRVVSFL